MHVLAQGGDMAARRVSAEADKLGHLVTLMRADVLVDIRRERWQRTLGRIL